MATKASTKKPDFEQSLKKLEAVVDRLEGGDLSLEKAVKEWEDGMKLRDTCEKISSANATEGRYIAQKEWRPRARRIRRTVANYQPANTFDA